MEADNIRKGLPVPSSKSIKVCFTVRRSYCHCYSWSVPSYSTGVAVVWGCGSSGGNRECGARTCKYCDSSVGIHIACSLCSLKNPSCFVLGQLSID